MIKTTTTKTTTTTNQDLFWKGGDKNPPQISKYLYLRQTKEDNTIRCKQWQVRVPGGGW